MSPLCHTSDTALGTDGENWKGQELASQSELGAQIHAEQQHLSDSTPFTLLLLHFLIIPRKKKR